MLKIIFLVILSAIIRIKCVKANEYKIVETENGCVRGRIVRGFDQKIHFAFKGIPFAKPPIGERRFKAPEAVDSWTPKTLDALEFQNACSQAPQPLIVPNEDCLYLNVFTPEINETAKLAVIVYVHGGSFIMGGSHLFGPDLIVQQNVILVTMNYRLGAFGFLSLGTPEYSGNMGLKDQRLAIKWIYDNIEHFGGDKTRITYSGQSAGAVSGLTLIFDPESRKYFKRLIIMSGAMLHSYPTGNHKCIAHQMAKILSTPINSDTELIDFLKSVPMNVILQFSLHPYFMQQVLNFAVWGPIIEEKDALKPIIAEDPYKLLKKDIFRNLSIYFTHTNLEYLSFEKPSSLEMPIVENAINTLNGIHLPLYAFDIAQIAGEPLTAKPYLQHLFDELRSYYFVNASNNYEKTLQYVRMKSDLLLNYYVDEFAQQIARKVSSVFYSRFSVDSALNTYKNEWNITLSGAAHSDDICYVFWCYALRDAYERVIATKDTDPRSAVSLKTIAYMTKLFSNFAKYGTPTVGECPVKGFEPLQCGNFNFLDITNDGLIVSKSPSGNLVPFVKRFRREAFYLIRSHCDWPKKKELAMTCQLIEKMLQKN